MDYQAAYKVAGLILVPHNIPLAQVLSLIEETSRIDQQLSLLMLKPGYVNYRPANQKLDCQKIAEALLLAVSLQVKYTSEKKLSINQVHSLYSTIFDEDSANLSDEALRYRQALSFYMSSGDVFSTISTSRQARPG